MIQINSDHPIDWLRRELESIHPITDVFSEPSILFILPDNLTIGEAKEFILREKGSAVVNTISFTTLDDLAEQVITEHDGIDRVEILGPEIRRILIIKALEKIQETDNLAKKFFSLIGGQTSQENEPIVDLIDKEFNEYLRSELYNNDFKKQIEEALHGLLPIYEYDTKQGLLFYKTLKDEVESGFAGLSLSSNIVLTRSDLIIRGRKCLEDSPESLDKILKKDGKIWVSGLSVFDTGVLRLLVFLETQRDMTINAGRQTSLRLEQRLKIKSEQKSNDRTKHKFLNNIEAPDQRREVEEICLRLDNDASKISLSNCILLVRDCNQYLPYIEEVMRDHGLPFHVQTRRRLSLTPPFRLIVSLLNLLTEIERGDHGVIEAHHLTDPLRLGFSISGSPLSDRFFLSIETRVGTLGRKQSHSWRWWKDELMKIKTSSSTQTFLTQYVTLLNDLGPKPSIEFLNKVLRMFYEKAADWKSDLILQTGYPNDHFECLEQHITSHSGRLFKRLDYIDEYAKSSKLLNDTKLDTWSDIRMAFFACSSDSTYGISRRDGQCIRVTDAGISHFNSQKRRYLIGMKMGTFPRSPPTGLLIPEEFRSHINKLYSELYLLSAETDFENEMDFFEVALGPIDSEVTFSMPYLGDRGNKEDWSCFVEHDDKPFIRLASHIVPEGNKLVDDHGVSTPSIHLRSVSEILRNQKNIATNFEHIVDDDVPKESFDLMLPRMDIIEQRIINFQHQKISLPKDWTVKEPYLESICSSIKTDLVTIPEVDLFEECPLEFYFYRFLYTARNLIENPLERQYVPEWKFDFTRGPTPYPLRRKHLSNEMREMLIRTITKFPSSDLLKKNLTRIQSELEAMKIERYGKEILRGAFERLIDLDESKFSIDKAGESSTGVWIYDEIAIKNKRINFPRAQARSRGSNKEPHSLNQPIMKRTLLLPFVGNNYSFFNASEYDRIIRDIQSMKYSAHFDEDRCSDCCYSTLCGYWGF